MYILENIFNNGFKQNSIILISFISVIAGILVIVSNNPVRSVLFLIGLFLTIALYLFILKMSFIALAYLLVYVGAVSILFLFILMLINIRISELSTDNTNSIPLSIIIITIFSIAFSGKSLLSEDGNNLTLLYNKNSPLSLNNEELLDNQENLKLILNNDLDKNESFSSSLFVLKNSDEKVFSIFSSGWDNILTEMSHITSIGNVLYVSYSTGILIVGLILLLSMIGAISVTAISGSKN